MVTKINKVLLVINPVSGDIDKQPIIDRVRKSLKTRLRLEIYKTTGINDEEKLNTMIRVYKPDRILVAGGDGTIKMVAQACENENIVLGILPAGSANGLATDLDLPMDYEDALDIALGTETIKMDALRIGDSIGLHISDMGINAELIAHYSDSAVRGHFGYFLSSIPTLWESEGVVQYSIAINGQKKEVDAVMVAFANSRKFGTGALINPNGKIDDGKFEVLIFKKLDFIEIFKTLRGEIDLDADFVEVLHTTEVMVTAQKPVHFQIDGEPLGEVREISVAIYPGYVEIAIGR
ncbi:MAG: diacylglycerol kinase family protein [Pricia sp.]